MPKTNFCKPRVDPRPTKLRGIIAQKLAEARMTQKALAEKVGMAESTLSNRIKKPETMRVGELWAITKALKFEDEEKVKIL